MRTLPLLLNLTTLLLLFLCLSTISASQYPPLNVLIPSDAAPLLSFKLKADLDNKLLYTLNERFDYCQWQGVKCAQGRVVRFVLESYGLRGTFPANTLTRLDQLRILSLSNNSLSGTLPDLSSLINLKSLFLNQNNFWGSFPPSLLLLQRLRVLDLSFNNFSGNIPVQVNSLSRLTSLELEFNSFIGSVPPLNITTLAAFNVSGNNLTGQVPVTETLSRFGPSSFRLNPSLCGEIVNKDCHSSSPFFDSTTTTPPPKLSPQIQGTIQSEGIALSPPSSSKHHSRTGVVTLGFITGVVVLLLLALVLLFLVIKRSNHSHSNEGKREGLSGSLENNNATTSSVVENQPELQKSNELVNNAESMSIKQVTKSGRLVFCEGETRAYTLEQLMRGSAELLGRGTIGTTYKAVLNNHLILTVKRLDAGKTGITSAEVFNGHMEIVGGLRHPNLVPVRAYFQAKEERLIIYDHQANGSLFNLIHGTRSTRAKPLHWTSCLKIADDVAQGLAYIHQASGLVHGNLKSSNVLLGSDFEACITDYSLAILADISSSDDPDSTAYRAPESRKSSRRATPKSDVYAFGALLLELLTGKHPSQHPFLVPTDVPEWVRAMRDEDSEEDNHLTMLVEIASICCITSPEQRPTMWQVLKMIQEIKESVILEDNMVNANRHHRL